jgi:hypothetical protein
MRPNTVVRVTLGELQLLWCVAPTEEVVQSCAGYVPFQAARQVQTPPLDGGGVLKPDFR